MASVMFKDESESEPRPVSSKRHLPEVKTLRPVSDSRFNKQFHHPWENRKALSEDYDEPASGREGWWRTYIRETPKPGSYEQRSFLEEMRARPNTYRFKGDGRKLDPQPHGKGAVLLPGAYEAHNFLEELDKTPAPATYRFKGPSRDASDILGFGTRDKDINVSPTAYAVEKYHTLTTDRTPSKHMVFKSQSKRFPTIYFKPKEGPAPGCYDFQLPQTSPVVSSSFKSKTPRFSTSHTRVPGPGAYEKTFQFPIPETISKMGRQYGLFFTSTFQI